MNFVNYDFSSYIKHQCFHFLSGEPAEPWLPGFCIPRWTCPVHRETTWRSSLLLIPDFQTLQRLQLLAFTHELNLFSYNLSYKSHPNSYLAFLQESSRKSESASNTLHAFFLIMLSLEWGRGSRFPGQPEAGQTLSIDSAPPLGFLLCFWILLFLWSKGCNLFSSSASLLVLWLSLQCAAGLISLGLISLTSLISTT